MDLQATAQLMGNFGEFVGAIAVVATLGYLAVQIRHSTVQARSEALRNATSTWVSQQRSAFATEQHTDFMRRALNDYCSLTADEKGRFFGVLLGYISPFADIYDKHRSGLMDEETFRAIEDAFANVVTSPGARDCICAFEQHTRLPAFVMDYVRGVQPTDREVQPMTQTFDFVRLIEGEKCS